MPAAVESFSSTPCYRNTSLPSPRALPACPELDCIRHLLPPGIIAAAELRATEVGVGADRTLIAADIISEEAYLAALTSASGLAFEPLEDLPREACPLSDEQLLEAPATGILPLRLAGDLCFVVASRALATRRLLEMLRSGSDLAARIRITTAERLQKFVSRHGARAMAQRTTEALLDCDWALLLMPLYWLLLSISAWRALDQLVRDPYRWEKTEHGLARNSRLMTDSDARKVRVRSIAAGRRLRPQAGA